MHHTLVNVVRLRCWLGLLALSLMSHFVQAQCFTPASVTASGFAVSNSINGGQYTPTSSLVNGAPQWNGPNGRYLVWSGSRWEIRVAATNDAGYNALVYVNGSKTLLPCSGWAPAGTTNYGNPTLTGACDVSLTTAAPSLSITAIPSLTVTPGSGVTLTAAGAATYRWQNNSTVNPLILANRTSNTNITLVGTTSGCSSTLTTTVVVAIPALTLVAAASPNPVRTGETINLSVGATGGQSPYTYSWQAPANASISGAANLSAITATASTSGLQTFTVTVSSANSGPVSTTTVSVQVNAPPPGISGLVSFLKLSASVRGCPQYTRFRGSGQRFVVRGPGYVSNMIYRSPVTDWPILIDNIKNTGTYTVCSYSDAVRLLGCTTFEVYGTGCR